MRLARPHFSVRGLMILVAIVAILIWAKSRLDARRVYFHELVRQYYDKRWNASAFSYSGPGGEVMEARMKADAQKRARVTAYYSDLILKYEYAREHPWLPVAPDPPEPR